jgi:hypothetical protein
MICFLDKTFCEYETCSKWLRCPSALGPDVHLRALAWWGKPDPPICVFAEKPECYNDKN